MTIVIATVALSALLCGLYLLLARRWQLFDTPNSRSSHTLPTPHGGGAALITAFILGLLAAGWLYGPWDSSLVLLALAAALLGLLGIIDDLRGLSVRVRLALYGLLCLLVALVLLHPAWGSGLLYGGLAVALATLSILWFLNLYNFMDGIDGIAAIQAVLACVGAALLSGGVGSGSNYALFCLLLAASHLGFLLWNWPPARLFMGDAGSVSTGFLLAALALLGAVQGQLNAGCWLVFLAVFITDTSCTLLWRMGTGQRFTRPHRLHAYQRLSRRWGSHLRVDLVLVAINLFWLYPLAWAVQSWPGHALFLVILAYLPLLLAMAKSGRLA